MEYRRLGNSGLKVSAVGLGGNNFGARANQEVSISVINHALELGINFIDTAALYAQGRSEELVSQAIQGKRSRVIVATKFGHPTNVSLMEQGGSRSYIMKAVDDSLRRLGTDYIDLYYMHHPDPETPVEETLRTLDDLIRIGKVRYIGYSNCAAWLLSHPWLASVIAGAMNADQLSANVAAVDWKLTEEDLTRLDSII